MEKRFVYQVNDRPHSSPPRHPRPGSHRWFPSLVWGWISPRVLHPQFFLVSLLNLERRREPVIWGLWVFTLVNTGSAGISERPLTPKHSPVKAVRMGVDVGHTLTSLSTAQAD